MSQTTKQPTMKHLLLALALLPVTAALHAVELRAGVAKVDITDRTVALVNDPCFAKALVLKTAETTVVLITLDAVSVGGIGRVGNGFMATVRGALEKDLGIAPLP